MWGVGVALGGLTPPARPRTAQKRLRLSRGAHRVVAVAAQLDVYPAGVLRRAQPSKHVREIDLALAEHQVVVDAGPHVLDVDVPQHVAPLRQELAHRRNSPLHTRWPTSPSARTPDDRRGHAARRTCSIVSMNMPGSGSNASRTPRCAAISARALALLHQPPHQLRWGRPVVRAPDQKLTQSAPPAPSAMWTARPQETSAASRAPPTSREDERRLVLPPRVEDEPGTVFPPRTDPEVEQPQRDAATRRRRVLKGRGGRGG
jgi:hypothetical protein